MTTTTAVVRESNIEGFTLIRRGKVRDVWSSNDRSQAVAVTTDRISVFDRVLPTPIPGKGVILNQMSHFFFDLIERELGISNHISTEWKAGTTVSSIESGYPELAGRVSVWRQVNPVLIEFIVRANITGSYWEAYAVGERLIHGHEFPEDLSNGDDLPGIIFTPSTKEDVGHDQNIDLVEYRRLVRKQFALTEDWLTPELEALTLKIGRFIYDYCRVRGIIFLDSKFEWGVLGQKNGQFDTPLIDTRRLKRPFVPLLIDEVVTPDSSRFVKVEDKEAGRLDPYDKQLVRNFVLEEAKKAGHPKGSPGFESFVSQLVPPNEIIEETARRYQEIFERLCS